MLPLYCSHTSCQFEWHCNNDDNGVCLLLLHTRAFPKRGAQRIVVTPVVISKLLFIRTSYNIRWYNEHCDAITQWLDWIGWKNPIWFAVSGLQCYRNNRTEGDQHWVDYFSHSSSCSGMLRRSVKLRRKSVGVLWGTGSRVAKMERYWDVPSVMEVMLSLCNCSTSLVPSLYCGQDANLTSKLQHWHNNPNNIRWKITYGPDWDRW